MTETNTLGGKLKKAGTIAYCEFSKRLRNVDRAGLLCEITRKNAGTGSNSGKKAE